MSNIVFQIYEVYQKVPGLAQDSAIKWPHNTELAMIVTCNLDMEECYILMLTLEDLCPSKTGFSLANNVSDLIVTDLVTKVEENLMHIVRVLKK
ncbi:hypothetical protein AVEN_211357-1 [Araneus ventricosus]|uniref:Uncharacterized protein n=1 Tax=Araneus ventricosus TaxID=182803 RepID=A0A4Y2H7I6_ARAVE|nr:hypothetical protein AVEN_211357-1 [Araneus ventricosus]